MERERERLGVLTRREIVYLSVAAWWAVLVAGKINLLPNKSQAQESLVYQHVTSWQGDAKYFIRFPLSTYTIIISLTYTHHTCKQSFRFVPSYLIVKESV